MTETYHLAVDLGATSGRTILASFNGEKVTMQELTRFKHPILPINNHLYWNLPLIYQKILEGLKKCSEVLSANTRLASIGIDSWGCDIAYFHKDDSLSGLPFCYRDNHTEHAAERFCRQYYTKEELYSRTGIQLMDINTLFQLDTIRRNSPEIINTAHKILFIPDALAYMLTGVATMEQTIASTSQMLNPTTCDLDNNLLKVLNIPREKFGTLVKAGDTIGLLNKQVQDVTGIGEAPVIAVAGHDTASAVAAVPSPDQNFAYLSCGTWSLLGVESSEPVINDKSRQYEFTNESGIDGITCFQKNICGLWLFERCRQEFKNAPDSISELTALYTDSSCDSIINPDEPTFANPTSMTEAISNYCYNTHQQIPQTPADFIRVIFRSLAKRYKEALNGLRELSSVNIQRLHVIGGGSQNEHLMQLTANEIAMPVIAGPGECTALGNILVQLRASGAIKNLDEMRKVALNSTETKTYSPIK